jgi:hypothetical protein
MLTSSTIHPVDSVGLCVGGIIMEIFNLLTRDFSQFLPIVGKFN